MPTSVEIETLHEQVREAAEKSGAYVAHALMELGEKPPPFVVIAGEEFPLLIAHVRPRIVFLLKSAFDVAEEIAASSDEDDNEDEQAPADPKLKRLLARWKPRNGSTCRMAIAMFCDGVMHSAVLEADWLEQFETDLERVEIEQAERRAAQQAQADQKRHSELQGQVEQLRADPRFSSGRVGRSKRITLATSLFPELDDISIRMIVDKAESEHWLSAGR